MKKIFYILASAIVALGAVACENEGLDNINPEGKGETLSFTAEIDNTRVALDGNQTIWVEGDELGIKGYTFVCQEDGKTFIGEGDGINAAFSTDEELTVWYNEELDSSKGLNGVSMKGVGKIVSGGDAKLTFSLQCALLKYTTTEKVAFAGTALSADFELAEAGDGTTQYVAINAGEGLTLSYSVDGVECKSLTTTFEVGYIYNLGNLSAMGAVAMVDGVKYASLDKAIAAAEVGATVTLMSDVTTTEQIVIPAEKEVVLDLGGYTIDGQIGTVEEPANTNLGVIDIKKGAKLTVKNGTINATINSDYDSVNYSYGWCSAIFLNEQGELIIESGEYTVDPSSDGLIVCIIDNMSNWGNGDAITTIKGGTFTFEQEGSTLIRNRSNVPSSLGVEYKAIVNIEGGEFNGNDSRFLYHQTQDTNLGFFNISGGEFNSVRFHNSNSKFTLEETWGNYNITGGTFTINKARQLTQLAEAVNNYVNYEGVTVKLGGDINFEGATFNAIGGVEVSEEAAGNQTKGYYHMFKGTFDGNGKTISNVTFVPASEDFTSVGLFGGLGDKAVVTNLILDNVTTSFTHYAGALAGWIGTTDKNVTISGITVKNSNIEVKPELIGDAYDNGDKAGGIVGYINADTGTSVTGCTVTNTKIGGYRDLGGIVGYARNATIQNNTVDNTVVITVNNDQNYKGYKIQSEYSVADYVGDYDTVGTNEGEATIEWGEIPESEKVYVAQVDGEKFETIENAIAAANGSTIELLADAGDVTISQACTINAGTYNINITVEGAFVKTVEGNVHTIEAAAKVWLLGDWNEWAAPFYMKEEGNYYVAHNVVIKEGQGFKFNDGTMYLGGASTANAWNSFSGSDIKLNAATYDIYVSKRNGAWCAVTAGSEAPALNKRYMYLKPDVWDTSSPKYVAWSIGGSNGNKNLSFSWAMYEGGKNYQVLEISDYKQFYIKRMSSDGNTQWNEVGPVTIGDNSLVTITGWSASSFKLGTIVP